MGAQGAGSRAIRAALLPLLSLAPLLAGCGGHAARTLPMRTALDEGAPRAAIAALNKELGVANDADLPGDIQGDNALLVLDRASIQQSLAQWRLSEADFQASDKAIDMLDLSQNASDAIGKYVFSDSAGRYAAPPYEKLLINTLNMVNYLEARDLAGAKIEARRLAVMRSYYEGVLGQPDSPILGLGGLLAGFAFEKSGDIDEALRWYDDALAYGDSGALAPTLAQLLPRSSYSSPRLKAAAARGASVPPRGDDEGEILLIVGYGRVPHKVPERLPIGLALTYVANDLSPTNYEAANRIAAQGLVTWVNFPTLAPEQGSYAVPSCVLDGRAVALDEALNVSRQVRTEWKKIEGKVILSAITRMIARFAAGQGIQAAAGRDSLAGLLLSLGAQATLTVLDTPDTRSWETLPARVAVARIRVKAGVHAFRLDARGVIRDASIDVPRGGWAVASLMALR